MVSIEYIAGFFDGEGFCTISKASAKSHSGSRYWLVASIANTHKGVMDEIQRTIGYGNVIFHKGDKGWKNHYRLTFYSAKALDFIRLIYPYTIVKKPEIELAVKYMDRDRSHHGPVRHPAEALMYQEECYTQMKALHGNKIHGHATITSTF